MLPVLDPEPSTKPSTSSSQIIRIRRIRYNSGSIRYYIQVTPELNGALLGNLTV